MRVKIWPSGRVVCSAEISLSMSARRVWGQLRDFHRFAAHDHFHAGFAIEGHVPRAGANLCIEHRYGPFHVRRVGKIVQWREGDGFAFSDLSQRGPRQGFPHVLQMRIAPTSPTASTLTIRVTGLWTSPIPHPLAKLWLRWAMLAIVQRTRNALLEFQVATKGPPTL